MNIVSTASHNLSQFYVFEVLSVTSSETKLAGIKMTQLFNDIKI